MRNQPTTAPGPVADRLPVPAESHKASTERRVAPRPSARILAQPTGAVPLDRDTPALSPKAAAHGPAPRMPRRNRADHGVASRRNGSMSAGTTR
jgi:hypothetical protein